MDRNERISFPFNIFATKGRKLNKPKGIKVAKRSDGLMLMGMMVDGHNVQWSIDMMVNRE